ncbi:late secretory pathway protein avl9 [Kappamyces sp. JEL0829]|nr:late secretory pathway protein avl9 [Kappamyces sp. JEL0829]
MCLPDGAHAAEEEYIYFHLPPVKAWLEQAYQQTLFGLACFRQIDSKDLLNRPADVTRTKVQKSVVVLANQCVLGSVRSKLGLVTQALFAQRDFSKLEIIDNLYENLNSTIRLPISDATLFMGLSLRELIYKFKQKALQLFKLVLLGKRVLFFGHKVERLSAYQYSLVSLIPELIRNLHDVGAPTLANFPVVLPVGKASSLEERHRSLDNLRTHQIDSHKAKLLKLGHPLRIFGQGSFFQPYIPLQQIDVLESPDTIGFLSGTSNSIFTHHKSCAIDVVAHADTGVLEIINPAVNALIGLSAADRKFIDDIIRPITNTWTPDDDMSQIQQIDFEGSDDDIRSRFEAYLTQLFASVEYDAKTPSNDPNISETTRHANSGVEKVDYISEYNSAWVAAWKLSPSFRIWQETKSTEYIDMINPGHPCHGHSVLDSIGAAFSAFGKNITPTVKAVATGSPVEGAGEQDSTSAATQMFQSVSTWYSSKFKATPESAPGAAQAGDAAVAEELKRIQQLVDEAKPKPTTDAAEEDYEHVAL